MAKRKKNTTKTKHKKIKSVDEAKKIIEENIKPKADDFFSSFNIAKGTDRKRMPLFEKTSDQEFKTGAIARKSDRDVDVDAELCEVTDFFKKRMPLVTEIVNLIIKFKESRKRKDLAYQIRIWNELLTKFVLFDLETNIAGEKMRKITHELVHEAETLHMKSEAIENIEEKSELL